MFRVHGSRFKASCCAPVGADMWKRHPKVQGCGGTLVPGSLRMWEAKWVVRGRP